jgi:hypothetical protein
LQKCDDPFTKPQFKSSIKDLKHGFLYVKDFKLYSALTLQQQYLFPRALSFKNGNCTIFLGGPYIYPSEIIKKDGTQTRSFIRRTIPAAHM